MTKENFNKKFLLRNVVGFTIIELMVSISIIALLSGVFAVNYHQTNIDNELKLAANKMASDIRLMQNKILGSESSWGINLSTSDNTNYRLFTDIYENKIYESSNDFLYKKIGLPNGIIINSLTVNGSSVASLNIVFFPPNFQTWVQGNEGVSDAYSFAQITLKNKNNISYKINVNFVGLVDVSQ